MWINSTLLSLSSISELLNTKTRTLKMYEEKLLLPLEKDKTIKKLYSIDDIKIIAFVHYLATIKKINSNGILYILEIIEDNMDLKHKQEFLKIIEKTKIVQTTINNLCFCINRLTIAFNVAMLVI